MTNEVLKEHIRIKFVEYLVDDDIRNDNGLKTLKELQEEYPMEWDEFQINFYEYE